MAHSQVVIGLFGPANEQVAEVVEPGVGALDHPAARPLPGFFGLYLFPARPDVGRVALGGDDFPYLGLVVARVQAPVLLVARRPLGVAGRFSRWRQARQRAFRQLSIIPVGPLQHQPNGRPCASVSSLRLTPPLPRSVGLAPVFFPWRRLRQRAIQRHPLEIEAD